jgi:hypothetical protein
MAWQLGRERIRKVPARNGPQMSFRAHRIQRRGLQDSFSKHGVFMPILH